ncbi:U2SURP [Symbiodinium pilosum]|uniref:U2SURP protein n=1 Tax=Symbiodinium pilosum TaxID=2952 RepID=A0A812WBF9_SYMPI|nr:U2SURP [Symbiodinium pilosum]
MLLSDAGFSLQSHATSQGFFGSSERATELMPWSDVQRVSVSDPNATPSQSSKPTRQSNNLFEAELQLSKPPGRLRLQFGAAGPAQVLQQLWQQSSQGVSPPLPGMDVLLEELGITKGSPPCPTRSLYAASLPDGATIEKVRQMFSTNGPSNPILRLHAKMGAQNMVERDWEPLAGGLVKCLHFVQPLKPQPMAPEKTRVSLVYFLCPTQGSQVVLQKVTRALDIPYANSFRVHHEHIFSEATAETKPQVTVDLALGINWVDRCFVKQIIESSTRRETLESMQDFMECMNETLLV